MLNKKSDKQLINIFLIFSIISVIFQFTYNIVLYYPEIYTPTFILIVPELMLIIATLSFLIVIKKSNQIYKEKRLLFIESLIILLSMAFVLSQLYKTYYVLRSGGFWPTFEKQMCLALITRLATVVAIFITCTKYQMWNKIIVFLGTDENNVNRKNILYFIIMFIGVCGYEIVKTGFTAGWSAWLSILVTFFMFLLKFLPGIILFLLYIKTEGIRKIKLFSYSIIFISIPYFFHIFDIVFWGVDDIGSCGIIGIISLIAAAASIILFAVMFIRNNSFGRILLGIMPKSKIREYIENHNEAENQ